MIELFGSTRTVVTKSYALLDPRGYVGSLLPGWENVLCNILISPAMGARFCQFLITFNDKEGTGRGNSGRMEYFGYVLSGAPSITMDGKRHRLEAGSYVFIPPGHDLQFQGTDSKIMFFQKEYEPLVGQEIPKFFVGHQRDIKGNPFLGNEDARLQVLLPDVPAFDLAVNIFTYQPGATLPFVETHVMEHGLLMTEGQGVYRLDNDYFPVMAGDVIWMAPYCPQWFVAMGKTPAGYIYYKDVNRDLM